MNQKGKVIAAVVITILAVSGIATGAIWVSSVYQPWSLKGLMSGSTGATGSPGTSASNPCGPGQVWTPNGNPACAAPGSTNPNAPGVVNPPSNLYTGGISFTVNEYWEYDASGQIFTSAVVNVYHTNGLTIAGTPTIGGSGGAGTATTITESTADNGVMVLGYLAAKNTAYWLDPVYTMAQNACTPGTPGKGCLKSVQYNLDPNNDGVYDIEFTMDLTGFQGNYVNAPPVTINLYGFKVTTSNAGITATSSPTGMNAAGTYTASGYFADTDNNGFEARIMKWTLWASHDDTANTTASSFGTLISAGTVTLMGVALDGVGAKTGNIYGATWGALTFAGVPNYAIPPYDATNTRWIVWQANPTPGSSCGCGGVTFDISQLEWGMPIIFERNAASNWFSYQIQFKTTAGAMTASSKYYIFLEAIVASGTASSDQSGDAAELKITLTG